MPDGPQRLASLVVVGGPLDGRRYDLQEVVTEVLLGSDPDCHLHVDIEGVSPIHARLWTELNGAVVHETRAPAGLFVNEDKVDDQASLKDGDSLWLGAPGAPGSVHVECRFEPWVEVLPEVPVDAEDEAPPSSKADDEAPLPLATLGDDEAFELDLGPGGPQAVPPPAETPAAVESTPDEPAIPAEAEPTPALEEGFSFEPGPAAPLSEPETPTSEEVPVFEVQPPSPESSSPPPGEGEPVSPEPPTPAPEPPTATPEPPTPQLEPAQLAEDFFLPAEADAPEAGQPAAPEVVSPTAEAPLPAAEAPALASEPPTPTVETGAQNVEDALFVEAEPQASESEPPAAQEQAAPADDVPSAGATEADAAFFVEVPETPVSPAAEPPPAEEAPPPAAPPAPASEDDPFFVGEPSSPSPAEPAAPPPGEEDAWAIAASPAPAETPSETPSPQTAPRAEPSDVPAGEDFFIAEEVPAEGAPPAAVPPEDALFVEIEESLRPGPEPLARAPLPPRQSPPGASVPGAEGATPTPPSASGADTPSSSPTVASPGSAPMPAMDGGISAEEAAPAPRTSPEAAPAPQAPREAPRPSPEPPERAPVKVPAARRTPAVAARPRPGPRRGAAAGVRRTGRRRPQRGTPEWVRPVLMGAGLAVVLGIIGFGLVWWLGRTVTIEAIAPPRARVGQSAVITGSGFSSTANDNTVLFGGARATVVAASESRLEVEVPEAVVEAGAERRVPVVVRSGSLESEPVEISVFQGPRLHGLSPDVALPGEEVLLAGAGWGIGATVRFGTTDAEILEIDSTRIRVTVPQLPGGYGASAPVVVAVGGVESNPAPFFVGRIPLVTAVAPQAVSVGDVLTVSGRGFERDTALDDVRVGGVPALVVSASTEELEVVVPRLGVGDPRRAVEVRVPDLDEVGQGVVTVAPPRDPVGLHFVAEPFTGPSALPHAVLATDLGPAFVLAASGGRSAAQRALAAQQALNAAVGTLASAPGIFIEARNLETNPDLGLSGTSEALLQVTPEDAAAYNEDWTRLRGRSRQVTPARLARWWEVVARDLVLVLLRGEPPRYAAGLAPEGRVFQQVYDAARRGGGPPVSRQVVDGLPASVREGLRVAALRVPVSVTEESRPGAGAATEASGGAAESRSRNLELEGTWTGSENEQGNRRFLTVTFRRDYGSIAYEGGITFEVPFLKLQRVGRDRVRFTVQVRGGIRHYHGTWNGETLSGDISRDEAGSDVVGSFELRPR